MKITLEINKEDKEYFLNFESRCLTIVGIFYLSRRALWFLSVIYDVSGLSKEYVSVADEQNGNDSEFQPPELPPVEEKPGSRKAVYLVLVLLLLIGGGVAGFIFWPKGAAVEVEPTESTQEQIGPRSILEGTSTLQGMYKSATGEFSGNISALLEEYEKSPRGISELLVNSIADEMRASNLYVRIIRGGFEVAYRKGGDRWLVLSWNKESGQKVSSVPSSGGPPFPVKESIKTADAVEGARELVEFKDPKDYFSFMLPAGFTTNDASRGDTTKFIFSYGKGVRMTIKAMKMNHAWNPEEELAMKAEQIQSGVVDALKGFELTATNLLKMGGATGYEIGLAGTGERASVSSHSFALGGDGVSISIAMICNIPREISLYEALIGSIKDTFSMGGGPEKRRQLAQRLLQAVAKKAAAQEKAKKKELNEAEKAAWAEAKATIKTSGIMRSGNAGYVALINDDLIHVGESISVDHKGKTYKFKITAITTDNVEMEPVLEDEEKEGSDGSVFFR